MLNKQKETPKNLTYEQIMIERQKQKKKAIRRENIKSVVKIFIKAGAGIAGAGALFEVIVVGSVYAGSYCSGRLEFEDREYYKNPNIEPGYYNEHPITLNISTEIDEDYKDTMVKAFKKFDKAAEGLSFDITYANPRTTSADINVYPDTSKNSWLAWATLNDVDDKKIKGSIRVDLEKTPSYLLGAVMQHELGHVVGLAHSKNPHDLMFPDAGAKFSLSKNDIQKINTIYPKEIEDENASVSYWYVPNQYLTNTTLNKKEEDDDLTL